MEDIMHLLQEQLNRKAGSNIEGAQGNQGVS